jgi:hypothetical protein
MHISIDNETNPMEMHHIAVALQRIAAERGYEAPAEACRSTASRTETVGELSVKLDIDTTDATSAVEALADLIDRTGVKVEDVPPMTVTVDEPVRAPADMTDAEHFQSCIDAGTVIITPSPSADTNLDVNGLPWDARIHAGSRERNTDGSWRVRRRPKGVEEADWDATLARVTAELTDLMAIPVADAAAEEAQVLTDAEVDAFVDIVHGVTGEIDQHGELVSAETVFVAPPVTIAPPVVVPPVTAVAPPITVDKPAIETFAQLMSWLTSRTPKDEAAKPAMVVKVNEILAANGLTTLQQLGQRVDLIPQVLVQFQAAFGE